MKRRRLLSILLPLLSLVSSAFSQADTTAYHAQLSTARARYLSLQFKAAILSDAENKERLCLLGELVDHDPVFALKREVIGELQAVTGEDQALADKLREFVEILSGFETRASSLVEA